MATHWAHRLLRLEDDPKAQLTFHTWAARAWLLALIATPFFVHPVTSTEWIALAILEISLYANWSTEYTAIPSTKSEIAAEAIERTSTSSSDIVSF